MFLPLHDVAHPSFVVQLGKSIDKAFPQQQDLLMPFQLEDQYMIESIYTHFLLEGRFELAQTLEGEAQIPAHLTRLAAPLRVMHKAVDGLRQVRHRTLPIRLRSRIGCTGACAARDRKWAPIWRMGLSWSPQCTSCLLVGRCTETIPLHGAKPCVRLVLVGSDS